MIRTQLPKKCFISYSYKDSENCKKLICSLAGYVDVYTFPPIDVTPDQLVSNGLVEAILDRDGLIYLEGGFSDESFWVAFERDYALRAGKRVYSARISDLSIREHYGKPLDLAVFSSYHKENRGKVIKVVNYLKNERHFDIWIDDENTPFDAPFEKEIQSSISDRIGRGGYVVVFWSKSASESGFVENELASAVHGMEGENDRVLFALLDSTPVPNYWSEYDKTTVQLFGDSQRSFKNRIDDLVVQLYWLIYKKSRHNIL